MQISRLIGALAGLLLLVACNNQTDSVDGERSPGNQSLVMSGYAAFAAGDMATVAALLDPDLVWNEAESLPYGGIYRGPDAVMENIFMAIARDWDDYAAEPQRFIDGGDHIVVLGQYRGVHRESGGRMQVPFAHVWHMAGGRLVEFHQFTDTAAWLAAAEGAELVD